MPRRRRTLGSLADPAHVVVCGSMSALPQMIAVADELTRDGIIALVPDIRDDILTSATPNDVAAAKRRASMRHIRRILDRRTKAIVVVNTDKYGVHDYIGPNAFGEIAVAFAHRRQIFLLQGIPENYADELSAWGAIPTRGDLEPVVRALRDGPDAEHAQGRQLALFP